MKRPDNPYVGPRPFQRGEPLFGRDWETRELRNLLLAHRTVLLHAPSGAGKTSLVQAGLLPLLAERRFHLFPRLLVGRELPRELLEQAGLNRYLFSTLLSLEGTDEEGMERPESAELERLLPFSSLHEYLEARAATEGSTSRFLLFFDQMEEILTANPTDLAEKRAFFEQVGAVLDDPRFWALFAVRDDYAAALDPYFAPLPGRLSTRFPLERLGVEAARAAIAGPVRQQAPDFHFHDEAIDSLVRDLSLVLVQQPDGQTAREPGPFVEPVHLQVVCLRLWERHAAAGEITPTDVEALGSSDALSGVDGALAGYFDDSIVTIEGASERRIRAWIERELISKQRLRNQVLMGEGQTEGLANEVIRGLIDAYLVRAERRLGRTWYELTHDRLVEPILTSNNRWRERLALLQRRAEAWQREKRPESMLLSPAELMQQSPWLAAHETTLEDYERDFLWASRAQGERQRELQRLRFVSVAQALAAQAARQLRQGAATERVALLALQAFRFHERYGGHVLDQMDEALREILDAPIFQSELLAHSGAVLAVALSPDGRWLLSAGEEGSLALWELHATPLLPLWLSGHRLGVRALAWHPDGSHFVSGSDDRQLLLWEAASRLATPLTTPDSSLRAESLAFSPDGQRLAASTRDGRVLLWEPVAQGAGPRELPLVGRATAVAFHPLGRELAASTREGAVVLWDTTTPEPPPTAWEVHRERLNALTFDHAGAIVWGARDGTIGTLAGGHVTPPRKAHQSGITALAFGHARARLYSASQDALLCWQGGQPQTLAVGPDLTALSLDERGGRLAGATSSGTVRLWELHEEPQSTQLLLEVGEPCHTLAVHPQGNQLLLGTEGGRLLQLPLEPGATPQPVSEYEGRVTIVRYSPSGQQCASNSTTATAQLWSLEGSGSVSFLQGHQRPITALAWSEDGAWLATGSNDLTIRLWRPAEPTTAPRLLHGLDGQPRALAFSPDGRWLAAAGDDQQLRLWELLALDQPPTRLGEVQGALLTLSWSPDSRVVAVGGASGHLFLWEAATATPARDPLSGHEGAVNSVSFSPDGQLLLSGSDDRTLRLWRWQQGLGAPVVLLGHQAAVNEVAFHPDGQRLFSCCRDGTLRQWLTTAAVAERLEGRLRRNISQDEWRRYIGRDVPYEATCPSLPTAP